MAKDASIALNRFGLGARPDQSIPENPRAWLKQQIEDYRPQPPALAAVPTRAGVSGELADFYDRQRDIRQAMRAEGALPRAASMPMPMPGASGMGGGGPTMPGMATPAMRPSALVGQQGMPGGTLPPPGAAPQPGAPMAAAMPNRDPLMAARAEANAKARDDYNLSVGARTNAAILSDTPFAERLVHFWSNHFAVSADKLEVVGLSGPFEFEAIRPHVMGRFGDMLTAVEHHPAMLLYLDQAQSVGPNSPAMQQAAARGRPNAQRRGLNENLAREIMELHTLGVRTGYTQADVTEFARAMTGWGVGGLTRGPAGRVAPSTVEPGSFVFTERLHEPGERHIVGKTYAQDGEAQAQAVLDTLATSPATAKHIATKLARHFAGDTPSAALVGRLQSAFLRSGGDLPTVYRALIDSPECWGARDVKYKTPWEWAVSVYRALDMKSVQPLAVVGLLNQLGQPTWKPGQPVGYDDIAGSWAGPDALLRRVEASERFAARAGSAVDARDLAPRLFPGGLSLATEQALARAESPGQGLALLLVAPEMLRR